MADATNKIAGKGKLGPEAAAQGASLVSDGIALMSKVTTAPSKSAAIEPKPYPSPDPNLNPGLDSNPAP